MNYGYDWYPVVLNVIARYPKLHRRAMAQADRQLRSTSPGAQLRRAKPRDVANEVLQPLSHAELREYRAVGRTIRAMEKLPFGAQSLAIVEMTDWKCSHNLWGAAVQLGIGRTQAQDLRARFVFLAAANLGYRVHPKERWKSWFKPAVRGR